MMSAAITIRCPECGETIGDIPSDGILCAGCVDSVDADVDLEDELAV